MKLLLVLLTAALVFLGLYHTFTMPKPAADHTGSKIGLVNAHRVKPTRHRTASGLASVASWKRVRAPNV
jgi:hypothetical protein